MMFCTTQLSLVRASTILSSIHAHQLDFLKCIKNNSRTNRGTSEGPEISTQKYLTGQIRFCLVQRCLDIICKVIMKKEVKIDYTKLDQTDLDFPCRELSVCGLRFVVASSIFRELIFRARVLGEQSSCTLITLLLLKKQCAGACTFRANPVKTC